VAAFNSHAFLRIDQQYLLGIPELDLQHREILKLARAFHSAVSKPEPDGSVRPILDGLRQMLAAHFEEEESFMSVIGVPDLDEHKRSHGELLQAMDDCVEALAKHGGRESLGQMVNDWVVGHLVDYDIAISDAVKRLIDGLENHENYDIRRS
jgi:hemerythrin-like metal-binding protein